MIDVGSVSGHFDIKVYDAYTGKLTKQRSFSNLITDLGLQAYCNLSDSWIGLTACVGNGTFAPAVTDTSLGNYLASASQWYPSNWSVIAPQSPDWVTQIRATVRFNAGIFDGTTITEIGLTNNSPGYPVFCRALILDDYGNPTALVILANEYFDVTYTLKYHPKLTDTSFQFTMNNVTYDCVARAAIVNQAVSGGYQPLRPYAFGLRTVYDSQQLGEITGLPTGNEWRVPDSASFVAYDATYPYRIRCNTASLQLGYGNFDGGIGAALITNVNTAYTNGIAPRTQVSFNPKLPKNANTEITLTLERTISRYVP